MTEADIRKHADIIARHATMNDRQRQTEDSNEVTKSAVALLADFLVNVHRIADAQELTASLLKADAALAPVSSDTRD